MRGRRRDRRSHHPGHRRGLTHSLKLQGLAEPGPNPKLGRGLGRLAPFPSPRPSSLSYVSAGGAPDTRGAFPIRAASPWAAWLSHTVLAMRP